MPWFAGPPARLALTREKGEGRDPERRQKRVEGIESIESPEKPDHCHQARIGAPLGIQDGVPVEAGFGRDLLDGEIEMEPVGQEPPAHHFADLAI
jgi:hypothetical protein